MPFLRDIYARTLSHRPVVLEKTQNSRICVFSGTTGSIRLVPSALFFGSAEATSKRIPLIPFSLNGTVPVAV
jgi:hypothetical protein